MHQVSGTVQSTLSDCSTVNAVWDDTRMEWVPESSTEASTPCHLEVLNAYAEAEENEDDIINEMKLHRRTYSLETIVEEKEEEASPIEPIHSWQNLDSTLNTMVKASKTVKRISKRSPTKTRAVDNLRKLQEQLELLISEADEEIALAAAQERRRTLRKSRELKRTSTTHDTQGRASWVSAVSSPSSSYCFFDQHFPGSSQRLQSMTSLESNSQRVSPSFGTLERRKLSPSSSAQSVQSVTTIASPRSGKLTRQDLQRDLGELDACMEKLEQTVAELHFTDNQLDTKDPEWMSSDSDTPTQRHTKTKSLMARKRLSGGKKIRRKSQSNRKALKLLGFIPPKTTLKTTVPPIRPKSSIKSPSVLYSPRTSSKDLYLIEAPKPVKQDTDEQLTLTRTNVPRLFDLESSTSLEPSTPASPSVSIPLPLSRSVVSRSFMGGTMSGTSPFSGGSMAASSPFSGGMMTVSTPLPPVQQPKALKVLGLIPNKEVSARSPPVSPLLIAIPSPSSLSIESSSPMSMQRSLTYVSPSSPSSPLKSLLKQRNHNPFRAGAKTTTVKATEVSPPEPTQDAPVQVCQVQDALLCGWLKKQVIQTGFLARKKWISLFAMLTPGCLYLFKSNNVHEEALESMAITDETLVKHLAIGKLDTLISLQVSNSQTLLMCEDDEDCNQWMRAFKTCLVRAEFAGKLLPPIPAANNKRLIKPHPLSPLNVPEFWRDESCEHASSPDSVHYSSPQTPLAPTAHLTYKQVWMSVVE